MLWAYVKEGLNGEEIFGRFYEEELQNKNQTDFRVEKVIKSSKNIMLNGKVMIIDLIGRLIKRILLYKMSYVSEEYIHNKNKTKVELGLSNYVTKFDLKRVTGIDLATFDLPNFKSDVDDLDIDKLKTVPVDLSKLSSAVKMMFSKDCI